MRALLFENGEAVKELDIPDNKTTNLLELDNNLFTGVIKFKEQIFYFTHLDTRLGALIYVPTGYMEVE